MDAVQTTSQSAILRKVSLRLIPFMLLLYVIAYLDRINISFAGLQMNKDLGFTPEIFGLGSGAFFYRLFFVRRAEQCYGGKTWSAQVDCDYHGRLGAPFHRIC